MTVRAVVFDVGETLVDETRAWSAWADYLGVPRLTFLAGLGAVIARGRDHGDLLSRRVHTMLATAGEARSVPRGGRPAHDRGLEGLL